MGQLIVGWSVGWSAPIIPKLQDPETSPLLIAATDRQVSWIGSLLYIGCVVDNNNKVAKTLRILGRGKETEEFVNTFMKKKGEFSNKINDWTEIFTIKSNRKSFCISFMLGVFQQFSGIAVVLFFATSIFQMAGSSVKPDVATIIIGARRLVSSFIAPILVERKGRRILLLMSTAACAFSLSILGLYFYLARINSSALASIGWLPLVSLIIYLFSYAAGFGTIPSALVGEMFRVNVRANGSALAITLTWVLGFILTTNFTVKMNPSTQVRVVNYLGGDVTFGLFGASCVLAFIFIFLYVPETKGKTLDEIQKILT